MGAFSLFLPGVGQVAAYQAIQNLATIPEARSALLTSGVVDATMSSIDYHLPHLITAASVPSAAPGAAAASPFTLAVREAFRACAAVAVSAEEKAMLVT